MILVREILWAMQKEWVLCCKWKVCLFVSVCECVFAGVRVLLCFCCVFGCLSQYVYVLLWACVHNYVFVVCLDVESNPLSGHCMFSYDQTRSRKGDVYRVRRLWDNSTSPARMITSSVLCTYQINQSIEFLTSILFFMCWCMCLEFEFNVFEGWDTYVNLCCSYGGSSVQGDVCQIPGCICM